MSKFKVGDQVFYAKCASHHQIKVPCPVCYGKLSVVLTLGNGDTVTLPCDYCGKGFDGPTGYTTEYEHEVSAQPTTITSVTITGIGCDETVEYRSDGCYAAGEDKLFATEKEALEAAKQLKAESDKEQATRTEYLKAKAKKSFSWNAGYHLRQAKDHRKQAEYHDSKAVLCKARERLSQQA